MSPLPFPRSYEDQQHKGVTSLFSWTQNERIISPSPAFPHLASASPELSPVCICDFSNQLKIKIKIKFSLLMAHFPKFPQWPWLRQAKVNSLELSQISYTTGCKATLFSITGTPFYVITYRNQGFQFLHILTNIGYFMALRYWLSNRSDSYLIVDFIHIFLTISNVEHLFIHLWPCVYPLWNRSSLQLILRIQLFL